MPRFLLPLVCCALAPSPLVAQGFVERLDPPALQRGKTTRLTAVGSRLGNAVDVWSSVGKLKAKVVSADKDGATFDVTVADDAPVGIFGLRVATADGLSNVHLCLIDDLPVSAAPDSSKAPAKVTLPCALWGRFREATVDRFAVEVKAGQTASFEAVGSRLGKEVDPLITIRDARDKVVSERDNDPGLCFDCRFSHRFAAAGIYTIEVRDSRYQGHPHGSYVLRMGRFPAARVAVPAALRPGKREKLLLPEINETVETDIPASQPHGLFSLALKRPGDEGSAWVPVEVSELEPTSATADASSAKTGTKAVVPGQLCGVLTKGSEAQFFRVELKKGQHIHVTGHGRSLNSPIDLSLSLTDEEGRNPRQASQGNDDVARLDFNAPKDGTYCLAVRDSLRTGGAACAYRLEVRADAPGPVVTAECEGMTVPRGGYQAVPLTVVRNNHAGAISLSLSGVPAGVTLTPSEIPAGVNAIVCKLSASDTAALGLHTLRIWAEPVKSPCPKSLVKTRPMIDRQLLNVDLIPYTLREDQTRLPASLADRLALQVAEAAPFTVEVDTDRIVLPRYQHATIPITTTRASGFDAPITFTASGGQLADKEEGRTRVYAEFPQATAKALKVNGSVHSRILANLGTTRIELRASATHKGREITLIRAFDLEIRTAFSFVQDKEPVKCAAGGTVKAVVKVERLTSFTGAVMVELSPHGGLEFPSKVTIPRGKDTAEIEVKVEATAGPGRRSIQLHGTGDVGEFEEEVRGRIEIEVPQPPKKK